MTRSAPQVSFSKDSVNYGTIDVGGSSVRQTYNIYQAGTSTTVTEAINMSISFKGATNASEAKDNSWVWISTAALARTNIGSVGGPEAGIGSITAPSYSTGASQIIWTGTSVPGAATTAGAVTFYLHHRYQYTGDDDDYAG